MDLFDWFFRFLMVFFAGVIAFFIYAMVVLIPQSNAEYAAFEASCHNKGGVILRHSTHAGKSSTTRHSCVKPDIFVEVRP